MVGAAVVAAIAVTCHAGEPPRAALPAWAPSGAEVAFTVPSAESAAIEVARPGAIRPSGSWLSFDSAPVKLVWAPVGAQLAYQKRTGAIDVVEVGRNGADRELVHAEFGTTTETGDWSADGRQLVFARNGHIHVLDVATGAIRYLVDGNHPTWSPDGLEIAYASGDELRGISPDGGPSRTIATAETPIVDIAWSPDSTRLAFVGKVIGIVTRFAGKPVYTVPAEPPLAWRPNGIFYGLEQVAPARRTVWRFDPDAGTTVAISHLPVPFDAQFVAVSRDGLRVAYQLDAGYLPAGVRIVDGDGRHDGPLLACHGTNRPDIVRGSRLNDVIRVNGGGVDSVRCGRGTDIVSADRRDRVARDCEVRRLPQARLGGCLRRRLAAPTVKETRASPASPPGSRHRTHATTVSPHRDRTPLTPLP